MMTEERGRTEETRQPGDYVEDEQEEATDRELEEDASEEKVEEEQESGGALPRSSSRKADESE
jgi:hypothetical protein